jgi:hypothetical protein
LKWRINTNAYAKLRFIQGMLQLKGNDRQVTDKDNTGLSPWLIVLSSHSALLCDQIPTRSPISKSTNHTGQLIDLLLQLTVGPADVLMIMKPKFL